MTLVKGAFPALKRKRWCDRQVNDLPCLRHADASWVHPDSIGTEPRSVNAAR